MKDVDIKQSCLSNNDFIKSIIIKKHETSKKTINVFSELKKSNELSNSEDKYQLEQNNKNNFMFNLKYTKKNIETPLRSERERIRPLYFGSEISQKNMTNDQMMSLENIIN